MAKTKVPGGYIDDGSITSSHLHSSHGITTNDIGEHTNNKYYTDARVDARLAASKSTNIITTGDIQITSDTGKAKFGTGNDFSIYHTGYDTYLDNATGHLVLRNQANDKDIVLQTDDGSGGTADYLRINGSLEINQFFKDIKLGDNVKANFGTSNDLKIYHDGNDSRVQDVGTGNLLIDGQNRVNIRRTDNGNAMGVFIAGGAVELYYNAGKKFETTDVGIDVTGEVKGDSLDIDGAGDISGNLVIGGNLTVSGTTTTVNTVTMNAQNAVVFEGATADDYETTLTIIDPTADRTINLPNQSGTIPVLAAASNTAITATPAELNYVDGVTSNIQTQLDAKQATISSSTDLTLSSIVTSSSNETRLKSLFVGADTDVYLYESATNAFTIRTGTSGAYKYFTFAADGKLNLANDGLQIGGTEVISGGRNISNVGTITASGDITTADRIISKESSGGFYKQHTDGTFRAAFYDDNSDTAIYADGDGSNPFITFSGGATHTTDIDGVLNISGTNKAIQMNGTTRINGVGDIIGTSYYVGGTAIVDTSRNLTNIGTIGSGAITSTGTIKSQATTGNNRGVSLTINGEIAQTSSISDWLHLQRYHDGRVAIGNNSSSFLYVKNYIDVVDNYRLNNTVIVDSSRNLTNIGTITTSGNATFGGNIIGNDIKAAGSGGLSLQTDEGTKRIEILDSGVVKFNTAYSFPTSDGTNGQALVTDGSGALSFATVSSGGSGFSTITEPGAGQLKIGAQSGANEGGEILLENAAANGGGSYTTDIHLDNYQNKFRIHSGGSVDLTVDTSGNVTVPGTLEGSGNILAQGYYRIHGSGVLLQLEEDAWTNATTHQVLYNGWTSSTGDYVYLSAAGNGTPVGRIIVSDSGGFYFGTSSSTTGAITDSATAPLTNTRFRVDNSGNVYPHGNISIGGTATDGNYGVYLQDNHWYATQYSSSHDVVRFNANTDGGLDIYNQTDSAFAVIRTGGVNIGSTQVIDGSRNLTNIGTISSGAITSSGAISTSSGGNALTTSANAAVFAHGFTAGSRGFNFESGDESVGTIRFDANTMRIWSGGAGGGNERIRINDGSTGGGDIFFYGSIDIKSGGLEIGDTSVINSSRVLQNVTANASIITAGTFGAARIPNLDAGKITSGTINSARLATGASGNWWAGNVVKVATDGVMEIGKYIDFHNTDTTTADYDVRLQVHSTNKLSIQGSGRILTTGDEGAGNGLDADTLDGQHGSYYRDAGNLNAGAVPTARLPAAALNYQQSTDDRDMKPNTSGIHNVQAIKPFFSSFGGMTGSANTTYVDVIAIDTYSDSSGGGPSAITFHKGESAGDPKMYIWKAGWNASTWGTGQRVFADNYHPNADTLTTARTIAGTSFDGSANINISYNNLTNKPTIPTNNNQLTNGAGYITSADGGNAQTLDGINSTSFARVDAGNDYTNYANNNHFYSNTNMATSSGNQASLECFSNGSGNDAFMTFHVGGDFACYFGLDGGTNKLSVGGWSMGANSYEIYHSGNKPSLATLGFTGASNANYITNNNQLTNGAGYITSSGTAANATQAGGLSVHSGRNNEANKIVRTDGNGYIQAGWINTTSGSQSSAMDRIYASYDGYIRYYTPANFLNGGGMGEKIFNNQGRNHSTFTDFNTTMSAGVNYLQQGNNGPTGTSSHQFYGMKFGLGNEYGTSGSGGSDYSSQMYFPRAAQGGGNGLYFRDKEGGSYGSWRQVDAGTVGTLSLKSGSGATGANQILRSHSNNYLYHQSWIDIGQQGLFSSSINGFHFYPNQLGSYGTARLNGTRGGYSGLMMDGGGDVVTGMFDGSGNGGDYNASSGWHYYYHRSNDCLGISGSTTSSSYAAYVNGALYATGDIVGSSDERLKTEIKTIPNALDKVLKLRGVTYKWKDTTEGGTCVNNITETRMGVIAQEVVDILPEVVTHDKENDRYGVSYGHLTGVLIEAVKELKQEVNELKKELEEVKNG